MSTKLKNWTQEEVDAIVASKPRDNLIRMPKGVYENIEFPMRSWFNSQSIFRRCTFGPLCKFTKPSKFETDCRFGSYCVFGPKSEFGRCTFGLQCQFARESKFDWYCTFGDHSMFVGCCIGPGSSIGKDSRLIDCIVGSSATIEKDCAFKSCTFEARISFGDAPEFHNCTFEDNHTQRDNNPILRIGPLGTEGRATTFFNCVDGMWVRTGCFFGSIEEFRQRVKLIHEHRPLVASSYLQATAFAESVFNERNAVSNMTGAGLIPVTVSPATAAAHSPTLVADGLENQVHLRQFSVS